MAECNDRIEVWVASVVGWEGGTEEEGIVEEEEEERRSRVSRMTAVFPTPLLPLSRTGRLTARHVSSSEASLVEWTRSVAVAVQ